MIEGLFAPMHLLVIGGIALLVFGPSRLPELGRGFGQAIRAFKVGLEEIGAPRPPATPELAVEAPVDPTPQATPLPSCSSTSA
jgi:sec-independent protein translocase protein TatA